MFDNYENSIELKTVFFRPTSNIPLERLNQFRNVLRNFQIDWGILLAKMYPLELKTLLTEFPELNFHVESESSNKSNTIFLSISKILN